MTPSLGTVYLCLRAPCFTVAAPLQCMFYLLVDHSMVKSPLERVGVIADAVRFIVKNNHRVAARLNEGLPYCNNTIS